MLHAIVPFFDSALSLNSRSPSCTASALPDTRLEGSAARGGLLVHHPGNAIRIAFGQNTDDVPGIESGFRRFAPLKLRPHINDVMRTNKNVVFLWTVTPPQEEINAVYGCLKG